MKEKYIKFLKKNVVVLVILLIVVCFSFGISYSNFIYNSNNHRAVEMHIDKLNYSIKINNTNTNEITVSPGNSLIELEIESLNKINTFYKLFYLENTNLNLYIYENNTDGTIDGNSKIKIKLFISNNSSDSINCKFLVVGGYINNTLDDIKTPLNYKEIKDKISVGDYFEYKIDENKKYNLQKEFTQNNSDLELSAIKTNYRILNINNDGTIDLIAEEAILLSNNMLLGGSNGYNNAVYILNDICNSLYSTKYSTNARNLNLDDIHKYTTTKLIEYNDNIKTYNMDSIYIPTIYEDEKNSIINNIHTNGVLLNSEGNNYITSNFKIVNSITLHETNNINKITKNNFINDIYYELFIEKNNKYYSPYYLSTRHIDATDESAIFGILSINNNEINNSKLHDIYNNTYKSSLYIRPVITISNNVNIYFDEYWKLNKE